jgi:flavodoxin
MKSLVAYYSRTGTTKTVGKAIAKELKADSDEIIDLKNRLGPINWIIAGFDATRRKLTKIKVKKKPESYDMVIVGTPIWSKNMTPAVRTYLTNHNLDGKKVCFFCTSGGDNVKKAFSEMKELVPKSVVVGKLGIRAQEVKSDSHEEKVKSFVKVRIKKIL